MAGIYIHIPFCKKACHYCDFHFSTSYSSKPAMVTAMIKEFDLRSDFLKSDAIIDTIYFGGGTPSVLNADEIKKFMERIFKGFNISPNPEITLEANPDDLDLSYLKILNNAGINRLSIGVQSFFDQDLFKMNRSHDALAALACIKNAQDSGYSNISIDLIYGLPNLSIERWTKNIETALNLEIQHLSAYCLTIEPKTALYKMVKDKKLSVADEDLCIEHFRILCEKTMESGFEQYEVSNFCKPGYISHHNSGYWRQVPYLGIGPSAHSFNGTERFWNIANNQTYIKYINEWMPFSEKEFLSLNERYNDYILTSLRTSWGSDLEYIKINFGEKVLNEFEQNSLIYINSGHIERKKNILFLTFEGKLIADRIISDLFMVD